MQYPNMKGQDYLEGDIERVTFYSSESGFAVLQLKVRGQRDLVTVVGVCSSANAGEHIEARGDWITDRQYGRQFKATTINVVLPATKLGMEKYLGSGLVKGIGPAFAKRLVDKFGDKIFDIIENHPEMLLKLDGIGEMRQKKITQAWKDQKEIRRIVVFLQGHGVGTARAVRIFKTYGSDAIKIVSENPYRLAQDIRGIGFKTADELAQKLGIEPHSLIRARAGVRHVLQELSNEGHCAAEVPALVEKGSTLLNIPEGIIESAIEAEITAKNLILDSIDQQNHVFLAGYHRAELNVVSNLQRLTSEDCEWMGELDLDKSLEWVQKANAIRLSESQQRAVCSALQNKVVVITGGPGVGKTTVVNSILTIIRTRTRNIGLAAPTGRAAKRLSEATGMEAKTLHRLLEFSPQSFSFNRNEDNPLNFDCLVVDETSMVDISMMNNLLRAVPDNCSLVLVGDVDQLPSVGPGSVLADLIDSGQLATIQLTEIFRQAASSQIIVNAHKINRGQMPNLYFDKSAVTDFYFINSEEPESILEKVITVVGERIPESFGFNPITQLQVLAPMNRGTLGVRNLNLELQMSLNPNPNKKITKYGNTFCTHDKVIQTVNNYDKDVYNGDIGVIIDIDSENSILKVDFDNRTIVYEIDELDELNLAYATTIHKAQGSEYPVVVMPIATQHYTLLEKNLLYTGITRGKSLVVLIGQKKAVAMAVNTVKSRQRVTKLKQRLVETNLVNI